ncbi:MAG TPA: protein kinase [Kofleriaceae bacterium]|nr:protein kinase [Kofleriaceae bacterium]
MLGRKVVTGALSTLQDRVLGDFVLGEMLDQGGFGTVYRAEQRGLGRSAVVKVIRRSLATQPTAVERFAREAQLASRFDHPYAAHIYAFGVEPDGVMWIAMELVKGTPLGELLRRSGPLPLERFVPLFERLCEVIQSAHDQGIVHRDIKPSNVMVLARAGRLIPKLLDFGIAKLLTATAPGAVGPGAPPDHLRCITGSDAWTLDDTIDMAEPPGSGSVTQEGQILGSPLYIAPEQWINATRAGPAADQYALALLAYEALTGSHPFVGSTVESLAYQHLHVPLRALPGFPAALHGVLARAADKVAERRFATVTELASALRDAAGIGTTELDGPPPSLPAELRTEWIHDAPRPIAESIAALSAARTPVRADERVAAIAALLARWIGVLAIACRSRLGRVDDTASLEPELLLALRRRALLDAEWLDLAVALARCPAEQPALWPVPEMATFLASTDAVGGFRALLGAGAAGAIDDGMARGALEHRIAQLAAVLDSVAWLLDYTVARELPGGLELWMGLRGDDRAIQPGPSDGSGSLVLLDGYGARLARLSPLFEVAAPMPGEAEELFVFGGPSRSGASARFISHPRGFEREDDRVWDWLAEHVLEAAPQTLGTSSEDVAPYPGLAAYSSGDHASFVGRERDVEELLNRLRTHAIVTVVGPSGIGKTSFLAAGVVPALGASWQAELVRPGNDPIGVLAGIVDPSDAPPYRGRASEPATTAAGIAAALAARAERCATHLAVVVDQAEELFTMCSDEAARDAFAEALAVAARHPRIRVVVSLRDDFLCRADQLAAWRGRIGSCVQVLRVPRRDDLERMIVIPARQRGYDFDDATLPAEIAAGVAGRPGALPLVAFTAAKLWELRDRHFSRMTRAAYERIGGIAGALVRHADAIVDRMPAPDRRLVRLAFRRLLSADGTRALIGRGELERALGGTPAARTVLDRLLAARLLVSRDDEAGDQIEIIHETLATTWPRLAAWRRDDAVGARLQDQLAVAARHWDERRRPADLLWRGAALADLVRWQGGADTSLSAVEHAFSRASIASAARARHRRIAAVAGAFAALAAGVLGLVRANHEIGDQRAAAVERLAANFEERGRLALADGEAARAMLYLAEAARLGAHGPGFDILTSQAAAPLDAGLEILGHSKVGIGAMPAADRLVAISTDLDLMAWQRTGEATHLAGGIRSAAVVGELTLALSRQGAVAAFDRDGHARWRTSRTVATPSLYSGIAGSAAHGFAVSFDLRAAIWDLATGQLRAELASATPVSALAIDPSGPRFAIGEVAGAVTIWDATTATRLATCEPHTGAVRAIVFAPDGRTVVTGGNDGDVRICDPSSGATVHRLIGHSHQVLTVDVSPDGKAIVSGGRDGKPRLWDARTGLLIAALEGHRGAVWIAAFSPDGSRVLTLGADDGAARLWNREGMPLGSLQGHGGRLDSGYWDRDQHHVITAGTDGAIRRWNVDLAIKAHPVQAHTASIADLAVSSDDRFALTASDDGTAVLWDQPSHEPKVRLHHDSKVQSVAFSGDGASALTTDAAGVARLWSIPDGALRVTLNASGVTAAAYTHDAGVVVTAGDGGVRFWTPAGTELGAVPLDYTADHLILDPGGRWLIAGGTASSLLVIDLASRTAATHLAIRDERALAVAADATRVAISDGRSIRLWQLGTWVPAGELTGHRSPVVDLRFLADGRLVSWDNDTVLVWGRDGQLRGRLAEGERVFDAAASADGTFIATISIDGAVRIWDAATYHRLLVLPSHRLPAFNIKLTHDGAFALSAGTDGRLVTWQLDHRSRSQAELAAIVRCRVPLRLEGDVALPRDLEFDDPTCAPPPR